MVPTLSIPGLVILPWRRRPRTGMPVSAAGFDTLDAVFTDRGAEFEQRVTQSMWREDADQGAPTLRRRPRQRQRHPAQAEAMSSIAKRL